MFSNQNLSAGRAAIGCASLMLLALAGCSSGRVRETDTTASTVPPPPSAETAAAEGPQTDTEALGDVGSDTDSTATTVMSNAGPALNPGAPKDYVVKRGDTLWGIANMFLRDPWLWPEIWYVNPKIENPHRIYPGDTVHLALSQDGRMALQVVHGNLGPMARLSPLLRSAEEEGPIETIPYSII